MDNKKFYRVFFETKHGRAGFLTSFFVDVLASNLAEAKETALNRWYSNHTAHAFHVHAWRLNEVVIAEDICLVTSENDAIAWFASKGITVS